MLRQLKFLKTWINKNFSLSLSLLSTDELKTEIEEYDSEDSMESFCSGKLLLLFFSVFQHE